MLFNQLVKSKKDNLERYIFYRGLGYSVEASELLACVTYGSEELAHRMKGLQGDDALVKLHGWLEARKASTPESALREYYDQTHRQPVYETIRPRYSGGIKPKMVPRQRSYKLSIPDTAGNSTSAVVRQTEGDYFGALPEYSLEANFDENCFAADDPFDLILKTFEAISSDAYEPIEEKSAKGVFTAPTSTFRMTTSTASMGILFNQLRSGRRISLDQVRIEEILNYFDYEVSAPAEDKFAISTELLQKSEDKKLLFVHVHGREEQREHQNIVLLLDVSGSMTGNAEVTQAAVAAILSKLRPGDRFSLVTYSSEDHTVVEGYPIRDEQDKEILMGKLLSLEITGGTWGSAGIETAYEIGARYYGEGWSNQVMLITDGDLNFGITDKGGLKDLIEEKKKSGLFLSVIGTGLWNYQDEKLEVLSKHGNGTYCVVNSLFDVTESIDRHYAALTNIIAKDVKAQLEFNPCFVKSYRLLGYENRELAHEDFVDDAVISEPYGSGGHGVALYELEMGEAAQAGLKYQTAVPTGSDELCTVKIRYKEPLEDVSHELEAVVYDRDTGTKNAELARLLYCVSEKLRGSDKLDASDEQFLARMLSGGKYKKLRGKDAEKLTLFVESNLRMPKSQKVSKKAVENPPYSFVFSSSFGHIFQFFQHLCRKPAFGLNQKRVCLRSEPRVKRVVLFYGHTAKPWPQRQPPQVGAAEPMQSVSFSSSSSQPPQNRQGAYLNSCTR